MTVAPWCLALALAACAQPDEPVIAPGGGHNAGGGGTGSNGGGGGGGGPDAQVPLISGRICGVAEVRGGATCAAIDGTGLTVSVLETGASATVAADGTFTVEAPAAGVATLVTSVDGTAWYPSAVRVDVPASSQVLIPVVTASDVELLLVTNQVTLVDGIVVVRVTRDGAPVRGATLSDLGGAVPYYDAGDSFLLSLAPPTGDRGTAVYFNAVGTATFDVTFLATTRTFTAFATPGVITWVDAPL